MPYDAKFTGEDVPLPRLSDAQMKDTVRSSKADAGHLMSQRHFTVTLCASRRLAWYSAANVDMGQKQNILRASLTSYWRVEKGLGKSDVTGDEWYRASNKLLQRGHLTPADCMEWGKTVKEATENANSTFFFSNAVPQMPRLNGAVWGRLEMFIGKEGVKSGSGRMNVATGPVLLPDDPEYVHRFNAQKLQVPRMFWKIAWYMDSKRQLSRVGFLMSQETLLRRSGLIVPPELEAVARGAFEDLGPFKTYQVNIPFIESLTGMAFAPARDPFEDGRPPKEVVLKKVDLSEYERFGGPPEVGFVLDIEM